MKMSLFNSTAKIIEPHAPTPNCRISALQKIADNGIPVVARIDPIIPTINDNEKDFEKLVSALADIGVKQITISTIKPVRGFFSILKQNHPKTYEKLSRIYSDGKWVLGYKYLHEEKRLNLEKLRPIVLSMDYILLLAEKGFRNIILHYAMAQPTAEKH